MEEHTGRGTCGACKQELHFSAKAANAFDSWQTGRRLQTRRSSGPAAGQLRSSSRWPGKRGRHTAKPRRLLLPVPKRAFSQGQQGSYAELAVASDVCAIRARASTAPSKQSAGACLQHQREQPQEECQVRQWVRCLVSTWEGPLIPQDVAWPARVARHLQTGERALWLKWQLAWCASAVANTMLQVPACLCTRHHPPSCERISPNVLAWCAAALLSSQLVLLPWRLD